jgi:hypothetical protein
VTDLPTFTVAVPGTAMSTIEGSDLYQRPDVYARDPERRAHAERAAIALRQARPRRNGGGVSYPVTLDVLAAAVVRDYCDTVGSTFAAQGGGRETQAEGRSLLRVAARIAAATVGVGWSAPSPRDLPRPL